MKSYSGAGVHFDILSGSQIISKMYLSSGNMVGKYIHFCNKLLKLNSFDLKSDISCCAQFVVLNPQPVMAVLEST